MEHQISMTDIHRTSY